MSKGQHRLEEMNKRREPEWRASVPIKLAWNDNNNSVYEQHELVERVRQFYKNDHRDAKRDLTQMDMQVAKAFEKEKTDKESVYAIIAQLLRKKLE